MPTKEGRICVPFIFGKSEYIYPTNILSLKNTITTYLRNYKHGKISLLKLLNILLEDQEQFSSAHLPLSSLGLIIFLNTGKGGNILRSH